eukprot:2021539-Rhodomonas_salina.1
MTTRQVPGIERTVKYTVHGGCGFFRLISQWNPLTMLVRLLQFFCAQRPFSSSHSQSFLS